MNPFNAVILLVLISTSAIKAAPSTSNSAIYPLHQNICETEWLQHKCQYDCVDESEPCTALVHDQCNTCNLMQAYQGGNQGTWTSKNRENPTTGQGQACMGSRCPVDGGWSEFGECSKTCDGGLQQRNCNNPSPRWGGKECVGDSTRRCAQVPCSLRVSLNYPKNSPTNHHMVQSMYVPEDYFIAVTFQEFHIDGEAGEVGCNNDYLQFCAGNGKCGDKMCGMNLPNFLIIPSNTATLVFHSNDIDTKKGFQFSYEKIDCTGAGANSRCGNTGKWE